jgi:predicted O-methyltransferase YrrM
MIKIVEEDVRLFDTSLWADKVGGRDRNRFLTEVGEHYRLLINLAHQYSDGLFYDIGTLHGASAIALGSNPDNRVITWDVSTKPRQRVGYAWPSVPGMDNIEFRVKSIFDEPTWIYDTADIICLDVSPHDGIKERQFTDMLEDTDFEGLLICDDIRNHRFPGMTKWWEAIKLPKWEIPYAHCSGTGIVSYGEEVVIRD